MTPRVVVCDVCTATGVNNPAGAWLLKVIDAPSSTPNARPTRCLPRQSDWPGATTTGRSAPTPNTAARVSCLSRGGRSAQTRPRELHWRAKNISTIRCVERRDRATQSPPRRQEHPSLVSLEHRQHPCPNRAAERAQDRRLPP